MAVPLFCTLNSPMHDWELCTTSEEEAFPVATGIGNTVVFGTTTIFTNGNYWYLSASVFMCYPHRPHVCEMQSRVGFSIKEANVKK